MDLKRYYTLVLLISSSLCYGFDSSSLKHASLGIGKLGLGFICGYIGFESAFQRSEDNARAVLRNRMLWDLESCYNNLKNGGISHLLFEKKTWHMDNDLENVFSKGCLIGVSSYGVYRCITSACESFKKVWKSEKTTEESKKQKKNADEEKGDDNS